MDGELAPLVGQEPRHPRGQDDDFHPGGVEDGVNGGLEAARAELRVGRGERRGGFLQQKARQHQEDRGDQRQQRPPIEAEGGTPAADAARAPEVHQHEPAGRGQNAGPAQGRRHLGEETQAEQRGEQDFQLVQDDGLREIGVPEGRDQRQVGNDLGHAGQQAVPEKHGRQPRRAAVDRQPHDREDGKRQVECEPRPTQQHGRDVAGERTGEGVTQGEEDAGGDRDFDPGHGIVDCGL